MFQTFPLSIIRSFWLYTQQICMTYTIAVCVQWETPDDGQRKCLKHVEFLFQESVHLVGFIIRIYHDARSRENVKKKKERQMGKRKYVIYDAEFYLYSYGMGNCWWFMKGCVFLFSISLF